MGQEALQKLAEEINMVKNHYGFGLRNDEKPYAHKIPPGGNWRALPVEEQKAFMKGSFGNGGGNSYLLRRMAWNEPAATVVASVMGKATCQLHPGIPSNQPCKPHESYSITPQLPPNGLTCVELFAGGGLMGVGLDAAGYNILWANDIDNRACDAYLWNLGNAINCNDLTKIDIASIPDSDVIAGGPPCQDWSTAGKGAGEEGSRGKLVWTYLDIISAKEPKAFLFENVKGIISKTHKETFERLLQEFMRRGYKITWKLVNALDHGVAQKRERVFVVGIRDDIGPNFKFPEIHESPKNIADAIGDLPESETPHPRRFTVREYLRLQSVPDWYAFDDEMPLAQMYRIVGNGVASKVAYDLGIALAGHLKAC